MREKCRLHHRNQIVFDRIVFRDQAKFVFEKGCEQIILGSGQVGNVQLSPEAEAYFAKKGCKVLLQPTPEGDP